MTEETRKPYLSDLIEPFIPLKIGKGEGRKADLREIMNVILS